MTLAEVEQWMTRVWPHEYSYNSLSVALSAFFAQLCPTLSIPLQLHSLSIYFCDSFTDCRSKVGCFPRHIFLCLSVCTSRLLSTFPPLWRHVTCRPSRHLRSSETPNCCFSAYSITFLYRSSSFLSQFFSFLVVRGERLSHQSKNKFSVLLFSRAARKNMNEQARLKLYAKMKKEPISFNTCNEIGIASQMYLVCSRIQTTRQTLDHRTSC